MTDKDRTFERIEALFDIEQFSNVRVLIIGCGSGGSAVALQLVMSGIRNFALLDNDVLGRLLRIFNDPALKNTNGDIFGRIYESLLSG